MNPEEALGSDGIRGGAEGDRDIPTASVGETEYVLMLANLPGLGPGRCARLLREFGSAQDALAASPSAWERVLGSHAARQFECLSIGSKQGKFHHV